MKDHLVCSCERSSSCYSGPCRDTTSDCMCVRISSFLFYVTLTDIKCYSFFFLLLRFFSSLFHVSLLFSFFVSLFCFAISHSAFVFFLPSYVAFSVFSFIRFTISLSFPPCLFLPLCLPFAKFASVPFQSKTSLYLLPIYDYLS